VLSGEQTTEPRGNQHQRAEIQDHRSTSEVAWRYVGASASACAPKEDSCEADDDCCSICLMALDDASVFDELGEPLRTTCGHRFHAVCFARHMEASQQDPWCPNCRGAELSVRF
jgi:hypothetical protein